MSDLERETPPAGDRGRGEDGAVHDPREITGSIPVADAGGNGGALRPDTGAAVAFLERWLPGGPWVLTAINPDGGGLEADTFWADDDARLRDWIEARQGVKNVYFMVNRTFRAMRTKASKADVSKTRAYHVDVDPRVGEDAEAERERAFRLLRAYEPPPTVIVDSGGGAQGFWLLEAEVDHPGDPGDESRHLPTEERNLTIEVALQADACHNIDRIMRLPGTVNVPGEKKRKRGRVARVARVVEADWTRRYRPEQFPRTPKGSVAAATVAGRIAVDLPPDLPAVVVASLPVSDRTKMLIVQGIDADNPNEDRSDVVWNVVCEMVRAECADATIAAVILDPDNKVSAHVLDQKPDPRGYAARQVKRAREANPPPGPVVANAPLHLARAFRDARRPHLLHHQQEFLDWDGAAYVAAADDTVRAEAWRFLETCRVETTDKDGKKHVNPLAVIPERVSATVDALKAVTHLPPSRVEPPRWLDGRAGPDPLDLLPTRSGLLHLPTGDLLPATPQFFSRNALDFAHDPAAPAPVLWMKFLKDVWPDDDEADCITALQEFMGYLLTPDTRLQKALMFDGPKRSGKGTIGRVMRRLVGEANTTAPSMNSLGGGQFGLEPLLAKQLAVISDMRLSNKTDEAALAENLLRITGEDPVSVNRKNRLALEVTLGVRFVVMTNEVPKFADRSGALVGRFIVLPMRQSFFGREDPGLTDKLMAELPGILNWTVEGWRRVRAAGRIKQPEGGVEVAEQMVNLSSPHPRFIEKCCVLHKDHLVEKDKLFRAFRAWFQNDVGQPYRLPESVFSRDLYSATDKAVKATRVRDGEARPPFYRGISLRDGVMAELERAQRETPF
jgi:P4 family phage/plasmid primase-like protien